MRSDVGVSGINEGSVGQKTLKVPLALHHVEIHPGDNGGISVHKKYSKEGRDYDFHTETSHYGPDDHEEAFQDAHSAMCSSCGGNMKSKKHGKEKKSERESVRNTRAAVGKAIASLGGKNSAKEPK